jgi:hypothetical protein
MTSSEKLAQMKSFENKISARYLKFFKLFLIITIILIFIVILSVIGIVFLGLGINWILFSFDGWIAGLSVLIGLFIILDILFYLHFYFSRRKRQKLGKPKPEYIDGKKVIEITFPKETDGGIFSKTLIEIDNQNILRLKSLMIPPEELW